MTREQAQRLVALGRAVWVDPDTLRYTAPAKALTRYADPSREPNPVVCPGGYATVRFLSRAA